MPLILYENVPPPTISAGQNQADQVLGDDIAISIPPANTPSDLGEVSNNSASAIPDGLLDGSHEEELVHHATLTVPQDCSTTTSVSTSAPQDCTASVFNTAIATVWDHVEQGANEIQHHMCSLTTITTNCCHTQEANLEQERRRLQNEQATTCELWSKDEKITKLSSQQLVLMEDIKRLRSTLANKEQQCYRLQCKISERAQEHDQDITVKLHGIQVALKWCAMCKAMETANKEQYMVKTIQKLAQHMKGLDECTRPWSTA